MTKNWLEYFRNTFVLARTTGKPSFKRLPETKTFYCTAVRKNGKFKIIKIG